MCLGVGCWDFVKSWVFGFIGADVGLKVPLVPVFQPI